MTQSKDQQKTALSEQLRDLQAKLERQKKAVEKTTATIAALKSFQTSL